MQNNFLFSVFILMLLLIVISPITACSSSQTVAAGGVAVRGEAETPTNIVQYYASEDIVYVTQSGKRYHRADCPYLSGSGLPVSREQAIAEGKTPCSRCHPDEK